MDALVNNTLINAQMQGQVRPPAGMDMKKLDEAAQEFEAVFIGEMIKPMFEGLETNSMFGGGRGEEVFRGFMIQEYGKIIAQTGSTGIADQLKAAMIELQEKAQAGQVLSSSEVPESGMENATLVSGGEEPNKDN